MGIIGETHIVLSIKDIHERIKKLEKEQLDNASLNNDFTESYRNYSRAKVDGRLFELDYMPCHGKGIRLGDEMYTYVDVQSKANKLKIKENANSWSRKQLPRSSQKYIDFAVNTAEEYWISGYKQALKDLL